MKTRGFTLIELMVVIVILGLLITLGSKGLRAARINAKKAQAQMEIKSIETAIQSYYAKYGKLPARDRLQGSSDVGESETESRDTIVILTAEDQLLNPAEMVFLETQGSASGGTFVDPWGAQYRILLDTDYDGFVDSSNGQLRRKVAVFSNGLYELKGGSDTNDLITSWQE